MIPPALEQFQTFLLSVLSDADQSLKSGLFSKRLPPPVLSAALEVLTRSLPTVDLILASGTDDPVLVFELAQCLGVPFVTIQQLDVVDTDDADSSGFVQDDSLIQVQVSGDTYAMKRGAIPVGARVLIFRDVLAEGIMTLGLIHLIQQAQAEPIAVAALVEKGYLVGRSRIAMHHILVSSLVVLARVGEIVRFERRSPIVSVLHLEYPELLKLVQ